MDNKFKEKISKGSNKIKVLMAASECYPIAKAGGLGDVLNSLPKGLVKQGVEVKIVMPRYKFIDKKYSGKLFMKNIKTTIENKTIYFNVYKTKLYGTDIEVLLIDNKLLKTDKIYIGARKYMKGKYSRVAKDIKRFILFSKLIMDFLIKSKWQPDIIHCHDWHLALLPNLIDEYYLENKTDKYYKTLLTIHNLASQGISNFNILKYAELENSNLPAILEDRLDDDQINMLKLGILSADLINTVSPSYSEEILTKEYGAGLESYLKRRKNDLFGILNGIDENLFNPNQDDALKKKYNAKNIILGKKVNKEYLQKKLSLRSDKNIPLFGLVSRLVQQKGIDVLVEAIGKIINKKDFQIVVLGSGQKKIENELINLAKKYPDRISVNIKYDAKFARQIYAGCDFFLMPSNFEPCGLGQMIALKYGTLPIVRLTGGLKDTIVNLRNGFTYQNQKSENLVKAIQTAINIFENKKKMQDMIRYGIKQDFSWKQSAKKYIKLYKKLM